MKVCSLGKVENGFPGMRKDPEVVVCDLEMGESMYMGGDGK